MYFFRSVRKGEIGGTIACPLDDAPTVACPRRHAPVIDLEMRRSAGRGGAFASAGLIFLPLTLTSAAFWQLLLDRFCGAVMTEFLEKRNCANEPNLVETNRP